MQKNILLKLILILENIWVIRVVTTLYTISYSQTWDNGSANVAGECTFLTWIVDMRSIGLSLAVWQLMYLRERIFNVKSTKEETIRRWAGDGDDYSVQSMLWAVATLQIPQRLVPHWILISGVPRTSNFQRCPLNNFIYF